MEQLLTTKFHIPSTRPDLVSRPRLIEQLNDSLPRKLTLISAPAGFGKTTLVSECVDNLHREAFIYLSNCWDSLHLTALVFCIQICYGVFLDHYLSWDDTEVMGMSY